VLSDEFSKWKFEFLKIIIELLNNSNEKFQKDSLLINNLRNESFNILKSIAKIVLVNNDYNNPANIQKLYAFFPNLNKSRFSTIKEKYKTSFMAQFFEKDDVI
jgi:hypothetical protein